MNRAVGAARKRFAQHLRCACRAGGADNHFAAMFLAKPQRLFERVRVRLVHLEAGILLADATPAVIDTRLPFAGGNLLYTHSYAHEYILFSTQSRRAAEKFDQKDLCVFAPLRRVSYSCFLNSSAA